MSSWRDVGPICPGDKSVLDYVCSHITSGVGWPAFDAGWRGGREVVAPEPVTITDASSDAAGGDAFYMRGNASGFDYWVGHITSVPRQGSTFSKGVKLSTISAEHETPHVHLAVDARKVLGRHLESGANYTTAGVPSIRAQLEAHDHDSEGGTVEPWVSDWLDWYVLGQHRDPPAPRPASAPKDIPDDVWELERTVVAMLKRSGADDCFQKWLRWYQGGKVGARPSCAPDTIFEEWWNARALALDLFEL